MSKLPTADQINYINCRIDNVNRRIDNGNLVDAIKMLRDITGMSLPKAKHIIELQINGPRLTMDRAGVLESFDGLWEYFKSLHVYDSPIDNLDKAAQSLNERLDCVSKELRYAEDQRDAAYAERDEYKSRLNAMRTTAGLEPLSTQNAPNPDSGFLTVDPEIRVMSSMVDMLYGLCPEDRCRVLDYLQRRFE